MKKYIITTFILLIACFAWSEKLSNIESAFVDIGLGARGIGMGGAYTALSNDANSLIWNPAGMALSNHTYNVNFDYADLFGLYSYSFFGLSGFVNEGMAAGIGMIYSGDDAMSETSIYLSGAILGEHARNYLRFIPRKANFGMNLKILMSSFGNNSDGAWYDENNLNHQVTGNAKGFAVDLGMTYKTTDKNSFAIMWRNPIGNLSWDSKNEIGTAKGKYSEGLPASMTFSYARIEDKFIVSMDLDKSLHSDTEDYLALGTEYHLFKNVMDLRAGYSQEIATGLNKKYSFGTGFQLMLGKNKFNVDIAYQIYTQWEKHNSFRISCALSI